MPVRRTHSLGQQEHGGERTPDPPPPRLEASRDGELVRGIGGDHRVLYGSMSGCVPVGGIDWMNAGAGGSVCCGADSRLGPWSFMEAG